MVVHECRGLALAPEVGDQQEPPLGSSTEAEISTSFIASAPSSIESLSHIERCYISQDLVSFHKAGKNGVGYCVCEGRSSSIVKVLGKHVNLLQFEAAVQVSELLVHCEWTHMCPCTAVHAVHVNLSQFESNTTHRSSL